MKRFLTMCLALSFLFSTVASADEGMWLYNAPPKDKIKAKYGFELTQQWLDHVPEFVRHYQFRHTSGLPHPGMTGRFVRLSNGLQVIQVRSSPT